MKNKLFRLGILLATIVAIGGFAGITHVEAQQCTVNCINPLYPSYDPDGRPGGCTAVARWVDHPSDEACNCRISSGEYCNAIGGRVEPVQPGGPYQCLGLPAQYCSVPRSADFTVNGQTSIIATFDTYLDFEGKQQGNVGCDLNLYRQDNSYAGPYKTDSGAGVSFGNLNADGTTQLTFSGQDGTFNSSKYGLNKAQPEPYGGYNFVLKCSAGSGVDLVRSVYVDFSAPAPANLSVSSTNCSAAGLSWNISPGGISGSGTSGSYTVTPGSGGTTYTISPSVSSSYTYTVSNSDTAGSSMLVYAGQNKGFAVNCQVSACPPAQSQTLQCPSGYTGTYTQTTTFSPPPTCPATVTNNQSSQCVPVGDPRPACRVDSFPDQWESGGVVSPTWATSFSNDVVLSGGQFGSGVQVESDGSRAINISGDTTLTITANSGATTCFPSASRSAVMHADTSIPMCTYPGEEYLAANDPNCGPDPACLITYFPDDGEDGNGWVYPQWQSNAGYLTLSGGPFNNTPVQAPNHSPDSTVRMAITTQTILTLKGNGGQCTRNALFYPYPPPGKPDPFTGVPGSCSTGQIVLSWGQSPGVGSYVLERDGNKIWEGGNYGNGAYTDVGRAAGTTYNYKIYGTSPNGNTLPNTVSVSAPPTCPVRPTGTISTNPTAIPYDSSTQLTWSSSDATSCSVNGSAPAATAGTLNIPNIKSNTTWTLVCTGPGGTSNPVSATVNVGPSSPTGFTVAPTSCGNNWLSLSWYAPSAGGVPTNYKVYRDGGATPIYNGDGSNIQLGGGAMGFSDTGLVAGSSHNYTVTASNASGTSAPASASGIVTASCTPTASIAANPTSVAYNSASTLAWSSTNATSCTASGGWGGTKAISGSTSTGPLISNTTYTLTCNNAGINSAPVSATVTVGNAPMTGTLTPQTASCVIPAGSSSCNINFSWTTTNPVATSTVTKPVNITVATGNSGTNVPFAVKYNTETFYLYNSGTELANRTVTSSCAFGSSWNGSICYAAPAFDFTLSDPGGISIPKGQSGNNTITANLASGSAESITFSFSNFPSGITPSASACSPSGSLPCTSTLLYTVGSSVAANPYYVRVTGTSASGVTHYREYYITVTNPTSPIVTCSVSPSTAKIGQSVTWSATVSGGTPPYTVYTWTGSGVPSPAPTGANFTTSYSTTGTRTAQVSVTDTAGNSGTCAQVSATINFDPNIIEF